MGNRTAVGFIGTVGVLTALAVAPTAQADQGMAKPDVWAGDYFSKTFTVARPSWYPWSRDPHTIEKWTVKRGSEKVAWKPRGNYSGGSLAPGRYKMSVLIKPDAEFAPATATMNKLRWGPWTWTRSLSNLTYTTISHKETTRTGGEYFYDREYTKQGTRFWGVYRGSCFSDDYLTEWPCYYYYDLAFDHVEVPADQVKPAPNGLPFGEENVFYATDGEYVKTPVVTHTRTVVDEYRGTGTVTMRFERGGTTYQAPVTIRDYSSLQDLQRNPLSYVSSNTRLTLVKKPPKVLARASTRFTVRARNGNDVTRREAHAIDPGDSMARVTQVFGTAGSLQIKGASGIQVRLYDGWVMIGYLNGRVNSIQYI